MKIRNKIESIFKPEIRELSSPNSMVTFHAFSNKLLGKQRLKILQIHFFIIL